MDKYSRQRNIVKYNTNGPIMEYSVSMKINRNDTDPNTTEAQANRYAKHATNYMKLLSKTLSFVFSTNVSSHKINKILQNISKSHLLYCVLEFYMS